MDYASDFPSGNNPGGQYVTLGDYNEVFPLNKIGKCALKALSKENYVLNRQPINTENKENFGAFSLSAAVRYPYSCRECPACHGYVIPGVN